MTKVLGITAEYDPFHNGHSYQLKEALKLIGENHGIGADDITKIAVISGNFTQRGEPAVVDKWSRAEMAIKGGLDLVVEMPFVYAVNNAGYFARAGVNILEDLGADFISFGIESDDISEIMDEASFRDSLSDEDKNSVRKLVKEGYSFPRALAEISGRSDHFGPNDQLAVEYIRNIRRAEVIAIPRKGPGYGDLTETGDLASATLIRKMLLDGNNDVSHLVPESTAGILERERSSSGFMGPEKLFKLLASKVASSTGEELQRIFGAEEGLGNKLKNEFRYAGSWEDMIGILKTKRYTRTRIQRVLIHTLMGSDAESVKRARNYTRILAMNDRGAAHLKKLRKSGENTLPLIGNINKDLKDHSEIKETVDMDIMAADIYNTALGRDLYAYSEYVKNPLKF